MSIVIESLPKGKREIRVSQCLDFDGLRRRIKEVYGKNYELIDLRSTKRKKGQILIGRVVKDGKGEVRIEEEKKGKPGVKVKL